MNIQAKEVKCHRSITRFAKWKISFIEQTDRLVSYTHTHSKCFILSLNK